MKIKQAVLIFLMAIGFTLNAQNEFGKVRVSVEAGYGRLLAANPDDLPQELEDYINEQKSGLLIDAGLGYFVKEQWGLELYFSRFSSKNSLTLPNEGTIAEDDVSIIFLAPRFMYRSISNNQKHSVISTFGIGYLGVKNEAFASEIGVFEIKASTVGFSAGVNYDYHISENIAIGASLNIILGSVSKYEITANGQTVEVQVEEFSGGAEDRESYNRFNLGAGIRFYL